MAHLGCILLKLSAVERIDTRNPMQRTAKEEIQFEMNAILITAVTMLSKSITAGTKINFSG